MAWDRSSQIVKTLCRINLYFSGICIHSRRLMEFYVPGLKEPDYAARIQFCSWLLQNVHNEVMDPQLLFIIHDLSSHVSIPKVWMWNEENPHVIQHMHIAKCRSSGVVCWKCAANNGHLKCFKQSVNSDWYASNTVSSFRTSESVTKLVYKLWGMLEGRRGSVVAVHVKCYSFIVLRNEVLLK
jgi:hypothetical protein